MTRLGQELIKVLREVQVSNTLICVCGHHRDHHGSDPDECDYKQCQKCPDCLLYHTKRTPNSLKKRVMKNSGFIKRGKFFIPDKNK